MPDAQKAGADNQHVCVFYRPQVLSDHMKFYGYSGGEQMKGKMGKVCGEEKAFTFATLTRPFPAN